MLATSPPTASLRALGHYVTTPTSSLTIMAGHTGFEPVDFCADNAARTLALSCPPIMVPTLGVEPSLCGV
jgi:hypothetical protein